MSKRYGIKIWALLEEPVWNGTHMCNHPQITGVIISHNLGFFTEQDRLEFLAAFVTKYNNKYIGRREKSVVDFKFYEYER